MEAITISSVIEPDPVVTGTNFKDAISKAVKNTAKVFKSWQEDTVSSTENIVELSKRTEPLAPKINTGKSTSWSWRSKSLSDIEDVVTMLDKQDDLEDTVTLSAIESEFFTSIMVRGCNVIEDDVRRELSTPAPLTSITAFPTTLVPTTLVTTPEATTRSTTAATTTTVASTSPPGSLVYDLKQLKATTSSKPGHKEKTSELDKGGRHRRLFKISSILQNRFKSIMKNLTANTKHSTKASVLTPVTSLGSKLNISKRTCNFSSDTAVPINLTLVEEDAETRLESTETTRKHTDPMVDLHADEHEGFKVTFKLTSEDIHKEAAPHPPETLPHGKPHPPAHPTSLSPGKHHQHTAHHGTKCKMPDEPKDAVVYLEPETYDDQLYYEQEPLAAPPTQTPPDDHCEFKREASITNTYTAKDVAALEVIVDLMKNTLSYEDNAGAAYQRSNTLFDPFPTRNFHQNGSTNAIQVHIAIPFNLQNGKKRSPSVPNPVRVRKVFCARMSTPVDLEYQVHSFEATVRPTTPRMSKSSNFTEDALSPGMYLLIDKPSNGYGLKPILGQINLSDLKSRQVAAGTTASMSESKPTDTREETTSLKSLAKVTLSKDFVAAVNQQLIEMYENMSRVNKDVSNRPARSVWKSRKLKEKKGRKRSAEKYIVKRGIDWEAIKHFFGHDRVCNCKCKSNTAMCRACAASDAVIDELIFEFDNIGRYMADHCTEIQTFFWMNPLGGQRLRESVNKIDKSLTDYYKRVKGKCQGRLCKAFTNYLDKRRIIKTYKTKKEDSMSRLINDLAVLAEDLNKTVSLKESTTTATVKESTTKLSFMNKLKAATQKFLKGEKTETVKTKTEAPTTTRHGTESILPVKSGVIDIVTDANKKVMDYVIQDTTQNATQNPTIIIINEYGNKVNDVGDKEEFKNLLLSIIQFETNKLNNEWERVAYAGDGNKNENDVKRSIGNRPQVTTIAPTATLMATSKMPVTSLYEDSLPELDSSTKAPEGLLNKIVNKMGIKVVRNKKKVVKKASIRQVRKDRKNNIIRNRKLRINSYRPDTTSPTSDREARDSRRAAKSSKICDIQDTYDHLKKLQRSLPPKIFEMVAKNITCYRYKKADPIFVIPYKRKGKRWDWIRNKRSLKLHFYDKDDHKSYDEASIVNFGDDSNDSFERFAKGDDGIYKIVKRRKRAANLEVLERGLRNIPNLTPGEDELFVMAGDTVTMDCGLHTPVTTCDGKFLWKTDRNRMLKQDNVYVDDVSLVINNVEPKNVGTYTCSLDHTVRKNVKLNVLTIPSFDIVFLPVYKTQDNCSYDELKAIQKLGSLMADEIHCGTSCAVRIDEPVCQRDKGTKSTLVRAAGVISVTPRALNCSLQCKRDIVTSLVFMCATNTAGLSNIRVVVSKDGVNETLTPWRTLVRPVVTHTLRKKDTNGHHEYHKLISLLAPGKVDVVLICPAGYYLLPKYKLCSSCPPNTSSKTGDNTCRSCPRGTRAEPGAAKCHLVQTHPRRYDWWWYPPCGYVVACCGVLFGCTACMLLSLTVHLLSRDAELKERESGEREGSKTPQTMRRVTVAYAHIPGARPLSPSRVILPRFFRPSPASSRATGTYHWYAHIPGARPLSPSRVILPRFFRPSPASSRATDSQETKFELWKERNIPPPLPPIDFDP
ncbi:hypothetical protein PYW07_011614 [Mythimna separata]|uniref:Ig-like domain-containing protein n=1 Tax=Mythimna separata TaxID=271217 RepID=A0AAD8DKJ0_MYTSE|nr:hypothetical protein PYW07_011614 [Mythimna separata]